MAVPQGYKFVYVVVPVFLIACVLMFVFLSKLGNAKDFMSSNGDNSSNGKEEDKDMDFDKLGIEIIREGSGPQAQDGDMLVVNYEGTLKNGTKFDSSYDRGTPYEFKLGAGEVISGWDEGLKGMKVGEERVLSIPSSLAYGSNDGDLIPAYSGLIFKVELLEIR